MPNLTPYQPIIPRLFVSDPTQHPNIAYNSNSNKREPSDFLKDFCLHVCCCKYNSTGHSSRPYTTKRNLAPIVMLCGMFCYRHADYAELIQGTLWNGPVICRRTVFSRTRHSTYSLFHVVDFVVAVLCVYELLLKDGCVRL